MFSTTRLCRLLLLMVPRSNMKNLIRNALTQSTINLSITRLSVVFLGPLSPRFGPSFYFFDSASIEAWAWFLWDKICVPLLQRACRRKYLKQQLSLTLLLSQKYKRQKQIKASCFREIRYSMIDYTNFWLVMPAAATVVWNCCWCRLAQISKYCSDIKKARASHKVQRRRESPRDPE